MHPLYNILVVSNELSISNFDQELLRRRHTEFSIEALDGSKEMIGVNIRETF